MIIQARKVHRTLVGFGVACALATALPCVARMPTPPASQGQKNPAAPAEGNIGFFSGLAIGGVAGGPVGAVAGGIGGALLGQHYHNQKVINHELARRAAVLDQAHGLTLNIGFRTGDAQLTPDDVAQLTRLAQFAGGITDVKLQVSGQADPRGGKEYNTALSKQRAESVAAVLQDAGLDKDRIVIQALGASASASGNLDEYALQRRVSVKLIGTTDVAAASVVARTTAP
jgi:outer membrane protein OmpA-like peptidoglycan-associated protein